MNTGRNLVIRCFVFLLVPTNTVTLTATRIILKHSNSLLVSSNQYLTTEFYDSNSNSNNIIGEGLFRSFHYNYNREQYQPVKPKYRTTIVKLISQRIRKLSFSLLNEKIYRSIIAAIIIALGSFPSHVIAETKPFEVASAVMQVTSPISLMSSTTTETIESETEYLVSEKFFLQHGTEAEKYWSYDENDENFVAIGLIDSIENTATNIEDNVKGYEREPITSSDCSVSTTKKNEEELGSIKDCYQRMVKIRAGGLLIATSIAGTAILNKKNNNRIIIDENAVEQNDKREKMIVPSIDIIKTTNLLPLCDPKYIQARSQPKSPKDEALLAARYEAISGLEEKCYQIIVDLGMIDLHRL